MMKSVENKSFPGVGTVRKIVLVSGFFVYCIERKHTYRAWVNNIIKL